MINLPELVITDSRPFIFVAACRPFSARSRRPSIAAVAEQVEEGLPFELTAIDLSKSDTHSKSVPVFDASPSTEASDPLWHSHGAGCVFCYSQCPLIESV